MYKLTRETSILRLSDSASIPADPRNSDYAEYLAWVAGGNAATPADEITRTQWEESARVRASRAFRINFEAVRIMLDKRDAASPDVPILKAFVSGIEPITAMNLAASTNEDTAYALMLAQYNSVRAAVPSPLRTEFSGIVANIIKRAL